MLGALGALLVRHFLFEGIYLKTNSMAPTLPQDSHVFVNKMAYLFSTPRHGDIVQIHTPQQPDLKKDLVKRVIAIGGDTIEVRNKKVYLNHQLLNEPYVQNIHPNDIFTSDNRPEVTVPKDCVVVMGDNRDVSGDSRDWVDSKGEWDPFVCGDSIQGRIVGVERDAP